MTSGEEIRIGSDWIDFSHATVNGRRETLYILRYGGGFRVCTPRLVLANHYGN